MKELVSQSGATLLDMKAAGEDLLKRPVQYPLYTVILVREGEGVYHADFGVFPFTGPVLLFSTPLQTIYLEEKTPVQFDMVQFHGDFYCIEYHRAEVACNGLLFNNIYLEPAVPLTERETRTFSQLLEDLQDEFGQPSPDEMVLRSYLQLFLAKSSSIKIKSLVAREGAGAGGDGSPAGGDAGGTPVGSSDGSPVPGGSVDRVGGPGGSPAAGGRGGDGVLRPGPRGYRPMEKDDLMERFRELLEAHYLTLHKPQDYASLLAMSPNALAKRSSRYFKKSPSELIQERLVLEAKKKLHLTRQSIKEIAYALQFSDEFYFSRFFKKITHLSPQAYRDKTGISIVADLYKY